MNWRESKRWSDKFLPEIKQIVGEHLISEPPEKEDAEHNTDLIVLRLDAVRIACRVRRHKYLESYGGEFTIRCGLPSGAKTELTKIIEGWGDYFFYGFANKNETALSQWILGDMKALRLYINRLLVRNKGSLPNFKDNKDGSSSFLSLRFEDVPGFVIASKMYDGGESGAAQAQKAL